MHGARRLLRAPLFTIVSMLVVGVGIGANGAVFAVVDHYLLGTIPVPNLDHLAYVTVTEAGTTVPTRGVTVDDFRQLRRLTDARIDGELFGVSARALALSGQSDTWVVAAEAVTGHFFSSLGLRPALGRLLTPSDDSPMSSAPLIVSYPFWRDKLGADPSVIGRTFRLSGAVVTLVGVAPEGFAGLSTPTVLRTDAWTALEPTRALFTPAIGHLTLRVFLRLGHPSSFARAATVIRAVGPQVGLTQLLVGLQPVGGAPPDPRLSLDLVDAVRGIVPDRLVTLEALLGSAALGLSGLVVLIACANVVGLALARAAARQSEMALRVALGASPARLLQIYAVETALLMLGAAAVGSVLAFVATHLMATLSLPEVGGLQLQAPAGPNLTLLVYELAAAVIAGFGVAAGAAATIDHSAPARIFSSSGGVGGATRRITRFRTILIGSQVAASVVILLTATLYARSAANSGRSELSVDADRLVVGHFNLALQQLPDTARPAIYARVLDALGTGGSFPRVALASALPLPRGDAGTRASPADQAVGFFGTGTLCHYAAVSPSFFDAVGLRVLRGRTFTEEATGGDGVVVLTESAAAALWPDADAVGRPLRLWEQTHRLTVIGVVSDLAKSGPAGDRCAILAPLAQQRPYPPQFVAIGAGGIGSARALAGAMTATLRARAPDVAVFEVQTLAEEYGLEAAALRVAAKWLTAFGLVGAIVALIGLYGVIAYLTSSRKRELGIMKALGASNVDLYRAVGQETVMTLAISVLGGTLVTLAFSGMLRKVFVSVSPRDPLTFIVVPSALFLVGLVAVALPLRRGTRASTADALRDL